ncbi:MAG: serine protease [Rhodospirillaceae bacterium]|jgi:S1-C subfamily serine protease|nr:serine protease [Rhodospirillaceae bacterium]MBT6118893.1 serine protease [Rhodospirillaceae bacterium]
MQTFRRFALLALLLSAPTAAAASEEGRRVIDAVVEVRAEIPSYARSADFIGTERIGSGAVIDANGLVLTIGYLILEAERVVLATSGGHEVEADIVGYDHATGFGLLRARQALNLPALPLGDSTPLATDQPVVVVTKAGGPVVMGARVADIRAYSGTWEYLIENAIFTVPLNRNFGGAALISPDGTLIGIGSLGLPDAAGTGRGASGNMFVPVNALKPVMAEMMIEGRGPDRRPWIGLYVEERDDGLSVIQVAKDGPSRAAGIQVGDHVVGVDGASVYNLADFYRKIWALGAPGVTVPIDVEQGGAVRRIGVRSADRYDWYRFSRGF